MIEEKKFKWYLGSLFDPFKPMLAPNDGWKLFFPDSGAKWFPTRGHMPMFEQNLKKVIFLVPFLPFLAHFLVRMGPNGPKLFFSELSRQMISNEGSHAHVWSESQKMVLLVPKWVIGPKKSQKMTFFKKWKKRPGEIFQPSGKHKKIIFKTIQGLKNPPRRFCPRTDGRTDGQPLW